MSEGRGCRKQAPVYSCCLCTEGYCLDARQYLCPSRKRNHCQPNRYHTKITAATDEERFIIPHHSEKRILISIPVWNTYHTANASISLHNALPIDVTRAWLTIGAQPGAMTACQLVTSETWPTLATSEGALKKRKQSETAILIH